MLRHNVADVIRKENKMVGNQDNSTTAHPTTHI